MAIVSALRPARLSLRVGKSDIPLSVSVQTRYISRGKKVLDKPAIIG